MMKPRIFGLLFMAVVAAVVVVLDQISKAWVVASLPSHETRPIVEGFARLRYVENTGAAFGFFQGWTGALSVVGIAITLAVIFSASRASDGSSGGRAGMMALALVTGGAIGNLIDRIRLGYVVDFIDVHGPRLNINNTVYSWPVFNVADSAITVGVVLLLLTLFLKREKGTPSEKDEPVQYVNPGRSA